MSCHAHSPLGPSCRFHYTMMAWLPSYFADTLSLNLTQAAQLSLLPPVAAIVASSIAGTAGDALISKGMPVVQVRKLAQCTAFLGPALCLAGASLTDDSTLKVGGCSSFDLVALQVSLGQPCMCTSTLFLCCAGSQSRLLACVRSRTLNMVSVVNVPAYLPVCHQMLGCCSDGSYALFAVCMYVCCCMSGLTYPASVCSASFHWHRLYQIQVTSALIVC